MIKWTRAVGIFGTYLDRVGGLAIEEDVDFEKTG